MEIPKIDPKNAKVETSSGINLYVNRSGQIVYKNENKVEIIVSNANNSINPDSYQEKIINISSFEILDLALFPGELLPELDLNFYYDILNIVMEYKGGTIPYDIGTTETISFKYENGIQFARVNIGAFADINNAVWIMSSGPDYEISSAFIKNSIPFGEKFIIRTETFSGNPSSFLSGDGIIKITLRYKVKTFTL